MLTNVNVSVNVYDKQIFIKISIFVLYCGDGSSGPVVFLSKGSTQYVGALFQPFSIRSLLKERNPRYYFRWVFLSQGRRK